MNIGAIGSAFTNVMNTIGSLSGRGGSGGGLSSSQSASSSPVDSFSGFSSGGGNFTNGGVTIPAMPQASSFNMKDPNAAAQYQEQMQHYTQMVQLRSQIAAMLHEARKAIVQNIRF
jgi:hypothetical protein